MQTGNFIAPDGQGEPVSKGPTPENTLVVKFSVKASTLPTPNRPRII